MLKKITLYIASMVIAFFAAIATASDKVPTIKLYSAPDSNKVVTTVPINAAMVPIIYKKSWAKVGLRTDGQVGWINLPTYEKLRKEFYQPNIQTIYISSSESDNGKPTVNIVAYRNGKKLSDKEAKAFYQKMLKQQQLEQHAQQNYWRHFNRMMRIQQRDMDQMFRDDAMWMNQQPVILMPGPVIIPETATVPADKKSVSAKDAP